jgi:hypothetical protein
VKAGVYGMLWAQQPEGRLMERTLAREDGHVRELTDEQSWELFDRAARHYLDLSGEEFLARWESGQYGDPDAEPGVMSVVMLLPFARSR